MMLISIRWRHSLYVIYLTVCTILTCLASSSATSRPNKKKKEAFTMTNIAPSLFRTLSTLYPKNFLWQQLADDDNRQNIFSLEIPFLKNSASLQPRSPLKGDESSEKALQPYISKRSKNRLFIRDVMNHPLPFFFFPQSRIPLSTHFPSHAQHKA